MLRIAILAGFLSAAIAGPVAYAQTPPAKPAPAPAATTAKYTTADTPLGTMLDDPAAKAVLDKNMPGLSDNPQIAMARGMTLKQMQSFVPDQIKEETLAKIDADLAQLK